MCLKINLLHQTHNAPNHLFGKCQICCFRGRRCKLSPGQVCVQLRQHRSPPTCNTAFVKPSKALLLSLPGITASGQPARTPGRLGESRPRSEQPLAGATQQQKALLVRNANYGYKSAWQFFIEQCLPLAIQLWGKIHSHLLI